VWALFLVGYVNTISEPTGSGTECQCRQGDRAAPYLVWISLKSRKGVSRMAEMTTHGASCFVSLLLLHFHPSCASSRRRFGQSLCYAVQTEMLCEVGRNSDFASY